MNWKWVDWLVNLVIFRRITVNSQVAVCVGCVCVPSGVPAGTSSRLPFPNQNQSIPCFWEAAATNQAE